MIALEEKIAILLQNYHNVILTTHNRNRLAKELANMIEQQEIFCGEVLQRVTDIPVLEQRYNSGRDYNLNLEEGRFKK